MDICLVSSGIGEPAAARSLERLAALLAIEHEVSVLAPPEEPSEEVRALAWACDEHRRSAGLMEAIRARYGARGPDYLELSDASALGFVSLQARLTGDPLLAETLVGLRASPSAELRRFHDGTLSQRRHLRETQLGREQLGLADLLVWPGGDTLDLYRRYHGEPLLPRPVEIGLPVDPPAAAPAPGEPGRALRILYLGELRRCGGPLDLAEACLGLEDGEWELTFAGRDTETATMGQSVAFSIEAMAGGDPRVRVRDELSERELEHGLGEYDLAVVPSRVAAWSEETVAAMRAGLPVLATPVGALVELLDGASGWLAEGIGREPLARAIAGLLADRSQLERLRASGGGRERAAQLSDPERVLSGYRALAGEAVPRRRSAAPSPSPPPHVTGVVPYYAASRFVADAVASLLRQTHAELDVLIVNDGSFAPEDAVLAELERDPRVGVLTQLNAGEAAARNSGARVARGEFVVMLDADNVLEPRFVERALDAFGAAPDLAYVTCWLRMIDEDDREMPAGHGYAPLGNAVVADETENWDGDALAMLPRRLFTEEGFQYGPEGAMHADWELYRWLRSEGRFGAVVPERLARYRVRGQSLLRGHSEQLRERGWAEALTRNRRRGMRWTARTE